ncbi:dynamin family protein [Alkalicoccus halolimnae]|uniref:Dynamin family protein n=1 Tax=Alkalicoccus halolimnae TaxID=1667239 RepID=A0A5C7FLL3_9BACI|nr:dynamin family protein [Alkalicoccus halolimnae]TXF87244.1 hypothetical protein FTX54_00530 [Alkalicoccus halolimnae]
MSELSTVELTVQEQERLRKIEDKKTSGIFEIAFCGHFSAGKSTLLNALVGAEVLPTSPIPTSANIIKITKGDFGLKLIGPNGKLLHSYEGEIPWSDIKQWGKDGEQISELHIQAPLSFLSENGVIADTPGVDSTDPTHASVTAEQLYSTDAIVYVMDYNHVQSETNLHFLKQLSESGKPVFIVINQVDKHEEKEMTAEDFRSRIDEVFEEWHIHYAQFYFTSMKTPDHPLNEFDTFKKKMKAILKAGSAFTDPSQHALKRGFYEALVNRLRKERETSREEVLQKAGEEGFTQQEVEEVSSVYEKIRAASTYEEQLEDDYKSEMKRLYDNVHLFPAATTELVERYVESKQKQFKVGFVFSGKKTKEEQQKRLDQLTVEVNDNLKSQLIYFVEDYFRKVPVHQLSNEQAFLEAMKNLNITITPEWIDSHVTTKSINREYIYTLTKQMNEKIVREVKTRANELLQLYIEGMKERKAEEVQKLEQKRSQFGNLETFHEHLTALDREFQELLKEAEHFKPRAGSVKPLEDMLREITSAEDIEEETFWKDITFIPEDDEEHHASVPEHAVSVSIDDDAVQPWIESVKEWKEDLKHHPLFIEEAAALESTVDNFEKSSFTISLFGAFSAGKSSFANALLGADIMPVSPHPTTATVNTVKEPGDGFYHGEAVVHFKDRTRLSEEIHSVGRSLRQELDIDSLPKWNYRSLTKVTKQQKSSIDYLKILQKTLRERQNVIGTKEKTSIDQLAPYIADEETACLIDNVTMYYDCPLTKEGIILVDTPGVNSIHGRHTNVAFKQLEMSDAIFYLTYYNHAFSKSDQYFLQQVSAVNESFANDKLYFVINASDLASTDRELQEVKEHVSTQLSQNGFANPRLFHVSSKLALKEGSSDSSFASFEALFYKHILGELKFLGLQLIQKETDKLIHQLDHYYAYMQEEETNKQKKLSELKLKLKEEIAKAEKKSFQYVERDAFRELEQLSLYLRKRMSFVLHDYFQEAVNVSVLTADSRRDLQQQLEQALTDWAVMGEQFLRQEWEAVSIRLDHAIQRLFRKWCESYEADLQNSLGEFQFPRPSFSPAIRTSLGEILLLENMESYKHFLKNKREFFEGGLSRELKDRVVQDAMKKITAVLKEKEDEVQKVLIPAVQGITEATRGSLIQALEREQQKYEALMNKAEGDFIKEKLLKTENFPEQPFHKA